MLKKLNNIGFLYKKHQLFTFLLLFSILIFRLFDIDIRFSSLFFNQKLQIFPLMYDYKVRLMNQLLLAIAITWFFYTSYILFWKKFLKNSNKDKTIFIVYQQVIYFILVGLTGPLTLIYTIKKLFQRARPFETIYFGGKFDFSNVFQLAHQCMHDCSFVSAHASIGFMLYAIAFASFSEKKIINICLATMLGSAFGFLRVIQGLHFLSDIVFSGFAMYAVCIVIDIFVKSELFLNNYNKIFIKK